MTEKMLTPYEVIVAKEAEIKRLRAALAECRNMVGHPDNIAFIDAALHQEAAPSAE